MCLSIFRLLEEDIDQDGDLDQVGSEVEVIGVVVEMKVGVTMSMVFGGVGGCSTVPMFGVYTANNFIAKTTLLPVPQVRVLLGCPDNTMLLQPLDHIIALVQVRYEEL